MKLTRMHDLPLLVNISVALGYALAGGLIARRLGLPTIVGYLLAGVALGPFTPGFRGDAATIQQMAEFGVILLMFGIGLLMSLIFAFIRLVPFVRLRGALAAQQLPVAAGHLDMIRRLVATNLVLGVLAIAAATLGRAIL